MQEIRPTSEKDPAKYEPFNICHKIALFADEIL